MKKLLNRYFPAIVLILPLFFAFAGCQRGGKLPGAARNLSSPVNNVEQGGNYIKLETSEDLHQFLSYTGDSLFLLCSHRGGPEDHLPENGIATFVHTLNYNPSMMEVDPRYTKDSVIVLHHDQTLDRTTTGSGRLDAFTWDELKKLRLKDQLGNPTNFQIPTLEEALKWAKGKTILVLDKKDVPIEERIKMLEACEAEAYSIVMAYNFKEAKLGYSLNKDIMMQVFIDSPEKVEAFDRTGVPWSNIVAFVGHQKPKDLRVLDLIHERGALCIMGTSRNLDRLLMTDQVSSVGELKKEYQALLRMGIDILETDIPVPVSEVLPEKPAQSGKMKFFN